MLTWKNFRLDVVQATIYTPDHSQFVGGKALAKVLRAFGDIFDGDIQSHKVPEGIPPEVPRIILKSEDGSRSVSIGPARFDAAWTRTSDDQEISLQQAAINCFKIPREYASAANVRVGRIAMVTHRVYAVDNPAQVLITRFCNAQSAIAPFNRSASFEIHNHKTYSPPSDTALTVNSWVRCKSAQLVVSKAPVILVEQDINTLQDDIESQRLTPTDIDSFCHMAVRESDDILTKYFPE